MFSFIVTVNFIVYNGAIPVFMDAVKYNNIDVVKINWLFKMKPFWIIALPINLKQKENFCHYTSTSFDLINVIRIIDNIQYIGLILLMRKNLLQYWFNHI